MRKKIGILFLVVVLVISFSTVIFAEELEEIEDKANKSTAKVYVRIDQGHGTIEFVEATNAAEPNDNASETGKEHPKNPIRVAGT